MADLLFEEIYKIEKDRLEKYYQRIRKSTKPDIENAVRFLENQSIGTNKEEILDILIYFKDKIKDNKEIIDFAFEWIRAHKIRLEYKKYLIRAQYDAKLDLAVDDCISRFFLEYNEFIRNLLCDDIKEFQISALLEIFFSPYNKDNLDLQGILKKHKMQVPTFFCGNQRTDVSIITLRSGLSKIIKYDYSQVLKAREGKERKKIKKKGENKKNSRYSQGDFGGAQIQRRIKAYCFNRETITQKDIERAVIQFLTPFFKFGNFYKFSSFREKLIKNFTESIYLGLSNKLQNRFPCSNIETQVQNAINRFREIHKIKELDGSAWKNDLLPILKRFLINFTDNLFSQDINSNPHHYKNKSILNKTTNSDKNEINFEHLFQLDLEIEEFRNKMEEELKNHNLGLIQRKNILRRKVQEFKKKKRECR